MNATKQNEKDTDIQDKKEGLQKSCTSLRCELCQEVFPSPPEWVKHIQETHPDDTPQDMYGSRKQKTKKWINFGRHSCTLCGKTFPSQASMMIHTRTHTGEKPFFCNICKKGFNVKSNLLRHMRTLHDHKSPSLIGNPMNDS